MFYLKSDSTRDNFLNFYETKQSLQKVCDGFLFWQQTTTFLRIDLSIYVAFQVIVKKTMYKTLSHGLQCKLKRPSHWTSSKWKSRKQSLSKMFCKMHSIPLVTPRKIYVLESLFVFITNLQAFLVKLQLILFA